MGKLVKVAKTTDVPDGAGLCVEAEGKEIALFKMNGQFYAMDNTCQHQGGPLGDGALEGKEVICPWHGWQYDVTTGVSPVNPAAKVQKYNCKVEGKDISVEVD